MDKNNGLFDETLENELGMTPDHIRGVTCGVHNCTYNKGDGYCTASSISIGPSYASACTDTVCATFRAAARD